MAIESPVVTFADDLRVGRGRAILTARASDDLASLRPIVLAACEHHPAYDPQCEGTRTRYLIEAVTAVRARAEMRAIVLAGLPKAERWDVGHFIGLAAWLACRDDVEARAALVEHTRVAPLSADACCALVEIDGEAGLCDRERGLLLAARTVGAGFTEGDEYIASAVHEDAVELLGAVAVEDALAAFAKGDPSVARFREIVREIVREASAPAAPRASPPAPPETLAELLRIVDDAPPRGRRGWQNATAWSRQASEREAVLAAEMLRTETDPARLALLLRMFVARDFPVTLDRVVALTRSEHPLVAEQAINALSRLMRPELRELAWSLVTDATGAIDQWTAVRLFRRNAISGDGARLAELLLRADADEVVRHGVVSDVLEGVPETLGAAEWRAPLEWAYASSPCSLCRGTVVEKLLEGGVLSDLHREECRWDAREDTRALVESAGGAAGQAADRDM